MPKNQENAGKKWSPADLSTLKKLAKGNTPTGLIAFELKRTESAVYKKANELSISLKPVNQSPDKRHKK